jgi:hypothetical protein
LGKGIAALYYNTIREIEEVRMIEEKDKKRTWGNVEPGPLSEGEAAALQPLKDNAARCKDVKGTNMDPEPSEGECPEHSEERKGEWQHLSEEEREATRSRKDGYPKNLGKRTK